MIWQVSKMPKLADQFNPVSVYKEEGIKFLLALQFLTRLPIPSNLPYTEELFAGTPRYYPLVGVIVGGICALVFLLSSQLFNAALAVALMMLFSVLLTGAFHEDGLADTFDGVGGGLTRDKALSIMKDSRLGTYGTLALVMVLLVKFAALSSLGVQAVLIALIAGHGLSRLSSVLVMVSSRYVRDHGTGKPVANGVGVLSLSIALITGLACLLLVLFFLSPTTMLNSLIGLAIGHGLMRWVYTKKLGGYTGDTLGAVQQVSEVGFYLGLVAGV